MSESHWRVLSSLMRPHRQAFLAHGLLMSLAAVLPVAASLVMARFVERVIEVAPTGELVGLALLFSGLGLLSSLFAILVTWRSTVLAWQLTNGLRHELADLVLGADLSFHRDHSPGELLTRSDGDVTSLTTFLSAVVARIVGIVLVALGALGVVIVVEPLLAPPLAAGLGTLGWRGWRTRDRTTEAVAHERAIDAEMNGVIEQYLAGSEDVAALGAGAHGLGRFAEAGSRLVDAIRDRVRAEMTVQSELRSIVALCQLSVLVTGVVALSQGRMGVGGVVLGYRLVDAVRAPVEHLTWRLLETQGVSGAAQRVTRLLEEGRRVDAGERLLPAGPLGLEFEGAGLVYDDASTGEAALRDLDLRLAPGRVVGLVGRTGSGKTTAVRLALRLVRASSGSVRIGGVAVEEIDEDDFRRRVGAIPQEVQLFPGTVRQNVALFGDADDVSIIEAVTTAGLGRWLAALPAGLDTVLASDGRSGDEVRAGLSAGEAQLLAIARALLRSPDVVVLDEATARVDPVTQRAISEALSRLVAGRTALVIAHRLETLDLCDDIAVLSEGRLVEFGDRSVLAADPASRYARLRSLGAEAEELS